MVNAQLLLDSSVASCTIYTAFIWGTGSHYVAQAGPELTDPPASASLVLVLKVCATNAWFGSYFLRMFLYRVEHAYD